MRFFALTLILTLIPTAVHASSWEGPPLNRFLAGLLVYGLALLTPTTCLAQDEVEQKWTRAVELLQQEQYKEAGDELLGLWHHHLEPSQDAIQVRRLADLLEPVLQHDPGTRRAFARIVADYRRRLDTLDEDGIAVWVVLESRLGETEQVTRWWRGLPDPWARRLEQTRPWVFELLAEQERWEEAGRVFPDPEKYARHLLGVYADMVKSEPTLRPLVDGWTATTFGNLNRALLAAGREEEAQRLREVVLEANSSQEVREALQGS